METSHQLTPRAHAELERRVAAVTSKHREEARALLDEGRVEPTDLEADTWKVIGRSSGQVYKVRRSTCPCRTTRDEHDPYACAHLLAVWLYKRVAEEMQKEGQAMFVEETEPSLPLGPTTADERVAQVPKSATQEQAQEAAQEAQEATNGNRREEQDVSKDAGLHEAPSVSLDEQRHTIRRLLTLYGLKLATKAEYEAAVETHVGLSLVPEQFGAIITRLEEMIEARKHALPSPKLLSDYTVDIKGKKYVEYKGLLAYAHEQGLVSLEATFISVTPTLALAEAKAIFADGRMFRESGEATPENVGTQVKAHFARISLTRAKARVLRDALNVDMVALEELGD
jgi:hypothetical protein